MKKFHFFLSRSFDSPSVPPRQKSAPQPYKSSQDHVRPLILIISFSVRPFDRKTPLWIARPDQLYCKFLFILRIYLLCCEIHTIIITKTRRRRCIPKICAIWFTEMRGERVKGRMELFWKLIRFGSPIIKYIKGGNFVCPCVRIKF